MKNAVFHNRSVAVASTALVSSLLTSFIGGFSWLATSCAAILTVVLALRHSSLVIGLVPLVFGFVVSSLIIHVLVALSVIDEASLTLYAILAVIGCTAFSSIIKGHIDDAASSLKRMTIHLNVTALLVFWSVASFPVSRNQIGHLLSWGEDSANVLDAVSQVLANHGVVSSQHLSGTGWLLTPVAGIVTSMNASPNLPLKTVSGIVHLYLLGGAGLSVMFGLVTAASWGRNTTRAGSITAWFWIGSMSSLPWIAAAMFWGHINSLLATGSLVLVVGMSALGFERLTFRYVVVRWVLVLVGIISMGGFWLPAGPVSLVVVLALSIDRIHVGVVRGSSKAPLVAGSVSIILAIVILLISDRDLIERFRPSTVASLSELEGGVSNTGLPLAALIFIGVVIFVRESGGGPPAVALVTYATVCTLLLLINFFQMGEAQYGALKLVSVVFGGAVPVALRMLRTRDFAHQPRMMPVAVVGVLLVYIWSVNPMADGMRVARGWISVAEQPALARMLSNADRPSVCLATDKSSYYSMYKCNRLVLGAQGLQSSDLAVFIGGNLCTADSARLYELPPERLRELQVLVSDATRLTSNDNCQARGWAGPSLPDSERYLLGWLTAMPWQSVDLWSADGSRLTPNFTYLKTANEYSDTDIAFLEGGLVDNR